MYNTRALPFHEYKVITLPAHWHLCAFTTLRAHLRDCLVVRYPIDPIDFVPVVSGTVVYSIRGTLIVVIEVARPGRVVRHAAVASPAGNFITALRWHIDAGRSWTSPGIAKEPRHAAQVLLCSSTPRRCRDETCWERRRSRRWSRRWSGCSRTHRGCRCSRVRCRRQRGRRRRTWRWCQRRTWRWWKGGGQRR
jgi:hypothetical protein